MKEGGYVTFLKKKATASLETNATSYTQHKTKRKEYAEDSEQEENVNLESCVSFGITSQMRKRTEFVNGFSKTINVDIKRIANITMSTIMSGIH